MPLSWREDQEWPHRVLKNVEGVLIQKMCAISYLWVELEQQESLGQKRL